MTCCKQRKMVSEFNFLDCANTYLLVGVRAFEILTFLKWSVTDSESVESPSYRVGLSRGRIEGVCSKKDGGREATAIGARSVTGAG